MSFDKLHEYLPIHVALIFKTSLSIMLVQNEKLRSVDYNIISCDILLPLPNSNNAVVDLSFIT